MKQTARAVSRKAKEWSSAQKQRHSEMCKRKERLTLREKLRIIELAETGAVQRQCELARMFQKSRMTISKLLRPENVAHTKAMALAGHKLEARRLSRPVPDDE